MLASSAGCSSLTDAAQQCTIELQVSLEFVQIRYLELFSPNMIYFLDALASLEFLSVSRSVSG